MSAAAAVVPACARHSDDDDAVRLRRAVMRLARLFNAASTDEELTPSQASVLGVLIARGPLSVSDLTRWEGLNPTMASRVVSALDARGLLQRRRDPGDLRTAVVTVTPTGRRIYARVASRRSEVVRALLGSLEPGARDALPGALLVLENLADHPRVAGGG